MTKKEKEELVIFEGLDGLYPRSVVNKLLAEAKKKFLKAEEAALNKTSSFKLIEKDKNWKDPSFKKRKKDKNV